MIASKIQTKIVHRHLFCPICADDVYQHLRNNTTPCPHVLYVYRDDVSDFVYSHHEIQRTLEEVVADLASDDEPMKILFSLLSSMGANQNPQQSFQYMKESQIHPVSLLSQKICQTSVLHLVVETKGIERGSIQNTIRVGYDFNKE